MGLSKIGSIRKRLELAEYVPVDSANSADARWREDVPTLLAEIEQLRTALKVHHDLGLWSLGHDVCPECHEPLSNG